jgi:hypothetical protein
MRQIDVIGLAGMVMWLAGALLAFPNSTEGMEGGHLLAGFLLLASGFACVIIWLVLRWFRTQAPR